MLAPVLAASETGEIEVFDVASIAKKRSTDLSVRQLGKEVRLPWEVNGQRWHTQECFSHDGQRCQWEGDALQYVIDLLAKEQELSLEEQ